MNPAPPLACSTYPPAQPQPEGRQHFLQCTAACAEHNAHAKRDGSNAGISCRLGRRFPLSAYFRQKSLAGWAALTQALFSAIAVISGCRSADENSRSLWRLGERFTKVLSAEYPALKNSLLLGFRPAANH